MIKIATRGSRLALKQSGLVQKMLKDQAGLDTELTVVKTTGDRIQDVPLSQVRGTGFFTREIENALLSREAQIAIHSLKDLPIVQPPELQVSAMPKRENPADILVTRAENIDDNQPLHLKSGLVVGTSAIRRQTQIKSLRPDLRVKELRGNVTTRLDKVRSGEYDAAVIAYAGLLRVDVDYSELEIRELPIDQFVPSPAQGALAVETRTDEPDMIEAVHKIHDTDTALAVQAERALLLLCGGGCHLPLGANLAKTKSGYSLYVFWAFQLPDKKTSSTTFHIETDNSEKIYDLVDECYIRIKRFEIEQLRKYYNRENKAINFLITRDSSLTEDLQEKLQPGNIDVISYPILNLTRYDDELWPNVKPRLNFYKYLIFTSANAVRFFNELLTSENIDKNIFVDTKFACVGEKTARACRKTFNTENIIVSPIATGEGLGKLLLGYDISTALMPCAREADFAMQEMLISSGWHFDRLAIYATQSTEPENLPEIDSNKLDYICFTAALAVEYTNEKIKIPDHAVIISIGPKTSRKIEGAGLRVDWELPNSNLEWLWRVL